MKLSIRLTAVLLVAVMALAFVGCHKKNETVMTVGDVAISSGLYLAFELEAYSQLIGGVNEQVSASSDVSQPQNYADYFNYEYENKKADTYITDRAKELATEYAVVQNLFKEYGLELTKEDTDYIESYAEYYWGQNIQATYEPNGVSLATYTKVVENQFKKNMIFEYYYDKKDETTGKGGLQTVPETEIVERFAKDYILADIMPGALTTTDAQGQTSTISTEARTQLKAKFDAYAAKLNKGEAFNNIYKEYTGNAPQTTVTTTEEGPNTIYSNTANVFSANDSDTTVFDMLKSYRNKAEFKYNTAFVTGGDTQGAYYLTKMYEIAKDPYYLEQYRVNVLHSLRDDAFDALLAEKGKALTVTVDNGLVKYYKPTKIQLDQAQ